MFLQTTLTSPKKKLKNNKVDLDIENVLAHCMKSDLETYQCWRHDGNEGFYEASDSDAGLAFVVVHDLLATTGFPNVR